LSKNKVFFPNGQARAQTAHLFDNPMTITLKWVLIDLLFVEELIMSRFRRIFVSCVLWISAISSFANAESQIPCKREKEKSVSQEILSFVKLCYDQKKCADAYEKLADLAKNHPLSPDIKLQMGGIALHNLKQFSVARNHFQEVLDLQKNSCLSETEEWIVTDGIGLSYMMAGDYVHAQPWFETSVKRWPQSSSSQYNLACCYCMNGNKNSCFSTFEKTLALGLSGEKPSFLSKKTPTLQHWIENSKTDPDLDVLRKDPRYSKLIKKYEKFVPKAEVEPTLDPAKKGL